MKDVLTARINLRLMEAELAFVRAQAAAAGMTVSEYTRQVILGRRVKAATPRVDASALSELRRVGGLLKHHAAAGNSRDVNAALEELARAARRIAP